MTHTITELEGGLSVIALDFSDEGVSLEVSRRVRGGADGALAYLPHFARDTRVNHAELFPIDIDPDHDEDPDE